MASGDTLVNASSSFASTGGNNTIAGSDSGSAYVNSEDSNILIGAGIAGIANECNVMRLGKATGTGDKEIAKTYVAGITGVDVSGAAVFVTSGNQLGVLLSTRRVKDNIKDLEDTDVLSLRPVSFNYNHGDDRSVHVGLIAEEVAQVIPQLVDYDQEGLPQSVKYHELPILLLHEIQRLNKKLSMMEAR